GAPLEGATIIEPRVEPAGDVLDATAVSVHATLGQSSTDTAAGPDGTFALTLPLDDGPAELVLDAIDAAGNVTRVRRHVRGAAHEAQILFTSADASATAQYTLTGEVHAAESASLNGAALALDAAGAFAATLRLAPGDNAFAVEAGGARAMLVVRYD